MSDEEMKVGKGVIIVGNSIIKFNFAPSKKSHFDNLDARGDGFQAIQKYNINDIEKQQLKDIKNGFRNRGYNDTIDNITRIWNGRINLSNSVMSIDNGRIEREIDRLDNKESSRWQGNNGVGHSGASEEDSRSTGRVVTVKTGFDGTNSQRYMDVETGEGVEFMRTPDGTVYGWVETDENGVKHMYLNTEEGVFNANTPVHEMGHFWIQTLKEVNNELWKKGIELAKKTKTFNTSTYLTHYMYNLRTSDAHLTHKG